MRKLITLLSALLLALMPISCAPKEPADPPVTEPTVFFSGTEEMIEQQGATLYHAAMNLPRLRLPSKADPAIETRINEILSALGTELLACPVDRALLISRYESDKAHFGPISRQITAEVTCIGTQYLSLLFRSETIGGGISAAYEIKGLTLPLTPDPAPLSLAQALNLSEQAAAELIRTALSADIAAHPEHYDIADPENPPIEHVDFVLNGKDGENGVLLFLSEGIAPGMPSPIIPISPAEIKAAT